MKFASMDELSAWLTDILAERMRKNEEAMRADGCTQEAIDAMKTWNGGVEGCHREALAEVERFISEPNAASLKLQ